MNVLEQICERTGLQRSNFELQPNKGLSCRSSSVFGKGSHLFAPIQISRQICPTLPQAGQLYLFNDTLKRRYVNIPQANYLVGHVRGDQVPTLSA